MLQRYCFLLTLLLSAQWLTAQDSIVIPLWQKGAPGFETKKDIAEVAAGWSVKNIHQPTITVFTPPKDKANGAAIMICPGGGFRNLGFKGEGVQVAKYFTNLGFTAFVLKYRLFREERSVYTEEQPKQDIFRAMRLVKSMAAKWSIDTAKFGIIGFSAGGEVAGWVSYHFTEQHYTKGDAVDTLSARPAFQILVYPGPLATPTEVSPQAPTTLLVVANNDACCSDPVVQLLQMHRKAKVPVEVHLYANGDHAFGMGYSSPLVSLKAWPQRMNEWLSDSGFMK